MLATARAIAEADAAETAAGSIAIIRPTEDAPAISPHAIDERIVEIGLDDARGLEFDHVIVCEPADFSAVRPVRRSHPRDGEAHARARRPAARRGSPRGSGESRVASNDIV